MEYYGEYAGRASVNLCFVGKYPPTEPFTRLGKRAADSRPVGQALVGSNLRPNTVTTYRYALAAIVAQARPPAAQSGHPARPGGRLRHAPGPEQGPPVPASSLRLPGRVAEPGGSAPAAGRESPPPDPRTSVPGRRAVHLDHGASTALPRRGRAVVQALEDVLMPSALQPKAAAD